MTGDGHFSHRIAFAPDGSMFISSGERQKMEPAQDPSSDLGKIIHMTAEGQRIGGHHYTMGHRNVLGPVLRAGRAAVGRPKWARRAATSST